MERPKRRLVEQPERVTGLVSWWTDPDFYQRAKAEHKRMAQSPEGRARLSVGEQKVVENLK